MAPQPPSTDPIWKHHTDGTIYWATCPNTLGAPAIGGDHAFWGPSAGTSGAPDQITPAELAWEAVDRMHLVGARVGATPLNPAAPAVVGIPMWLWVDSADEYSWGPITATASAGGVTVTATARATSVVWDTGDGTRVTCRNPGTEWTPNEDAADSPTCGHTYLTDSVDQPDGVFHVRATTHWRVEWAGAGQTGTITFTLTGPTRDLHVIELHVLQTG